MRAPLTKTERKILVYKKCKQGLTYREAYAEVEKELVHLNKMTVNKRVEGRKKETSNIKFKESFEKLRRKKDGKKNY